MMRRIRRFLIRRWRALLLGLLLLTGALGTFTYFWVFHDLPSVDSITEGMALPSTRIYDRNGQLLYEILPPGENQGRNTTVTLDEIPDHCVNAAIATEDANFYSHAGVDPVGIMRALWINLRGGEVIAGGSTITQQTARLLLMDPNQRLDRTLRRKLREMVLAVRLQNRYSKDEVLSLYLNQMYFGNLAYGIEGAARTYFAKPASDLSLSECALLAGLMQNPSRYDPFTRLDDASARQETVLNLMAERDYITAQQAGSAADDTLQFAATRFPIEAPHAVMTVWERLERDYPEYVYGGGLNVTTSIDLSWTDAAQRIVESQLTRLNSGTLSVPANADNAAVVAMNPHTGQVHTLLGSPDYFDESIDGAVNAALMPRQPGSTLKPLTYAAAMNPSRVEPYTPATVLLDVRTPFVTRRYESYVPSNFGRVEHGLVSVREALASSYNIPAVKALDEVGVPTMIQLASDAGLEMLTGNTDVDLSVTLGGGEVRLLDLVQAYSAFANGGYRVEPSLIQRVETRDGEVLYEHDPPPLTQRVMDERVAYLITDILSDEEARIPSFGRGSWLSLGRPAAAKTGTTTDFRDNWVVGYTPNLVVGVWVGNADNTPMVDVTGIDGAGPIWHHVMRNVLLGEPERAFQQPDGIVQAEVCAISGKLPTEACTHRVTEKFIAGTVPDEYDNTYQTFEVDTRTGLLADEDTPPEYVEEKVFVVLPEEARDWGRRNGINMPPPEAGTSVQVAGESQTRLLSPDPYTIFEISPVTPRQTQRIRLRAAAPDEAEAVTLRLEDAAGEVVFEETMTERPWETWWVLQVGSFELTAEARLPDGTTQQAGPRPFTVTEYAPPQESYSVQETPLPNGDD